MSYQKKYDELTAREMFLEDLKKWLEEYIWEQEKDVVLAPDAYSKEVFQLVKHQAEERLEEIQKEIEHCRKTRASIASEEAQT